MLLGSEQLLASSRLNGLRVGVLANPASIDHDFRHVVDRLNHSNRYKLTAIFGPQHGYRSDLQDNMIETPHAKDRRRNVPIFSLYSETREPTKEMLDLIDVLVIDLQDVGARIYTFIYTMANCLRAASRHGLPVIVCDRPNPIGGTQVEGPTLEPGFESFVGQFRMPMRHGMTVAELAKLFNEHHGINAALEVFPMEGWSRDMYWDATDLPWVMPSPNMPTIDTAIVYPGTVLYEGTKLSEGRGTTRPFELIGAPWLDGDKFAERMNKVGLKGVHFRGVTFEPTFQKHARAHLRRLPDPCHQPRGFSSGEGGRVAAPRMLRLGARSLRLARSSLRIRARQDADRHSRGLASPQSSRSRSRRRLRRSSRAGAPALPSLPKSGGTTCSTRRAA